MRPEEVITGLYRFMKEQWRVEDPEKYPYQFHNTVTVLPGRQEGYSVQLRRRMDIRGLVAEYLQASGISFLMVQSDLARWQAEPQKPVTGFSWDLQYAVQVLGQPERYLPKQRLEQRFRELHGMALQSECFFLYEDAMTPRERMWCLSTDPSRGIIC